jgi:hypothetical protein
MVPKQCPRNRKNYVESSQIFDFLNNGMDTTVAAFEITAIISCICHANVLPVTVLPLG